MQVGIGTGRHFQDQVVAGHTQQAETNDQHAGDGAALEGHVQRRRDTATSRFSRAHVGADRNVHADETGCARKHGTDQEADGRRPAQLRHKADDQEHQAANNGDSLVLPGEIGRSPLLNRLGNFLHALVTRRHAENLGTGYPAVNNCQYSTA